MSEPRIVVALGWGSLIEKPEQLAELGVRPGSIDAGGSWRGDGPLLPLELARMAIAPTGGTKYPSWVITPGVARSPALYAELAIEVDDDRLLRAAHLLARREGADISDIGRWPSNYAPAEYAAIGAWAAARGISGVIWTALAPRWNSSNGAPSEAEVIALLRALVASGQAEHAEHYIRTTPAQIRSPIRAAIERELGWRCDEELS